MADQEYDQNDPKTWSNDQLLAATANMNPGTSGTVQGTPQQLAVPPPTSTPGPGQASPPAGEAQDQLPIVPEYLAEEFHQHYREGPDKALEMVSKSHREAVQKMSQYGEYAGLNSIMASDTSGQTYQNVMNYLMNKTGNDQGTPAAQNNVQAVPQVDQVSQVLQAMRAENFDPKVINGFEQINNQMKQQKEDFEQRFTDYSTANETEQRRTANISAVEQFVKMGDKYPINEDQLQAFALQVNQMIQPSGANGSFTVADLEKGYNVIFQDDVLKRHVQDKIDKVRNSLMNANTQSDPTVSANPPAHSNQFNTPGSAPQMEAIVGDGDKTGIQQRLGNLTDEELISTAEAQGLIPSKATGSGLKWR